MQIANKRAELDDLVRSLVRGLESTVVAFSGGVDSSVVLALALEELGPDRVLAVTAASETYLPEEIAEARVLAQQLGARHEVIETAELEIPGFVENPPDRCYHCKTELYGSLRAIAEREGLATVVDGANSDDSRDFRPGHRAADEAGVRHPLMEAGLGKESVRSLALRLGLDNWAKPSSPCLSSRFPYGESITLEKLAVVRAAEAYLRQLGSVTFRVRYHGRLRSDRSAGRRTGGSARARRPRRPGHSVQGVGLQLRHPRSGRVSEREHERGAVGAGGRDA